MDNLRIEFSNPQGVFFPGQIVQGRVIITNRESLKARFLKIGIHGTAETHWSEHERRTRTDTNGREESYSETIHYGDKVIYLEGETVAWRSTDGSNRLVPGENVFPFSFSLPLNCPPSFEGHLGCIRYVVHVELDRPWKFNKKTKRCFSVVPAYDLNVIPNAINPMVSNTSKNTGILFKKGVVSMTVSLPKRGFVAGEILPINLMIDNGSKKPVAVLRAKINQTSTYYARRGASYDLFSFGYRHATNETKCETKMVAESRKTLNILPHAKETTSLSLRIPAIVPNFQCPIIAVDYCLSVKVDTTGTFGNTLKCEFPLIIGTIPIRQMAFMTGNSNIAGNIGMNYPSTSPTAPPMEQPTAPPYPVIPGADMPPPYPASTPSSSTSPSAPPPSYEESVYGQAGTTKNSDEIEPFAPRYPVYNNLEDTTSGPLPTKF